MAGGQCYLFSGAYFWFVIRTVGLLLVVYLAPIETGTSGTRINDGSRSNPFESKSEFTKIWRLPGKYQSSSVHNLMAIIGNSREF